MSTNLADVAALIQAKILDPLQEVAEGVLEEHIAEAQAERGKELLTEMFALTTAPSGAPWLPPAHDYGHPLLHDSGDMQDSGTCTVGPRLDATGHDITFEFTDEKAPWQHGGTRRGGIHYSGTRRKSGADGSSERQHIPPRHLLPEPGEEGPWVDDLTTVGQVASDQWLRDHIHI